MGLARAFTRRFVHGGTANEPTKPRPVISMPMGLISTTKQGIEDLPNIATSQTKTIQQRSVTTSSGSSFNESDGNSSSSPDTPAMTDASSVESYSPIEPNHLTQYFPRSSNKSSRSSPVVSVLESSSSDQAEPEQQLEPQAAPKADSDAASISDYAASEKDSTLSPIPALPKRAASHSKHEHERLARVRSVRSSTGLNSGISSLRESATEDKLSIDQPIAPLRASTRPSSDAAAISSTLPSLPESNRQSTFNPFSAELVQLDEVAEGFSNYTSELTWEQECEEDIRVMREKGLKAHRASEYLRDIELLRIAMWDLAEEKEGVTSDDDDEEEEFHDAVSDWI